MSRKTLIFVYGTLKCGGSNHHHLTGQTFVGEAHTPPGFTLYSLGDYPGMVRNATDTVGVAGEIWSVDDACLARLDELEGVNEKLYERTPIILNPPFHDKTVETYLYLRDISNHPHLGAEWTA